MKPIINIKKLPPPGRRRFSAPALALLVIGLIFLWLSTATAARTQEYESLRLLSEALHEISNKYVHPKTPEGMINGSLRGMVNSLDPDSSFMTPEEYREFQAGAKGPQAEAGMELVVKDHLLTAVSTLDGGPAARAGLLPGDHILKVNGKLVRNLTTQEGVRQFRGRAGASLKLQVLRNGLVKPLDLTVTLEPLGPSRVAWQILKDGYAYVRIPFFTDETPEDLAGVLKRLQRRQPPVRGLILDLRNNARGSMEQAVRTAAVLLGEKEIVSTRGRLGETEIYQGKFRVQALKQPLPLMVLVDQGTARAAEIVAAALRDQDAGRLLGAKTFGLCGITKVLPLQDGSALMITVAQCYTPKGLKITGNGLDPEVEGKAPPAVAGRPEKTPAQPPPDQDPWVLQALEVLKTGKPTPAVKKSES